jgi:ribosomal protein S18 acetylase RimI-like enzyme
MIKKLSDADFQKIYDIVNEASVAYKGKIPSDCYNEPYMPKEELQTEMDAGVQFYSITIDGTLAAVMGIQPVGDVTLIRHAYTLTRFQRQGLGEQLLNHLISIAKTERVLIGTWTDATWAIKFYQKHGFVLLSREETNKLLNKYWHIPQRQIETSVVLEQWRKP